MSLSFVLLRGRSTLKTTLVSGLTFPTHMNVWVEDMIKSKFVQIVQVLQHNSHTVVEAVRPGRAASEGFRMEGVGSALHVRLTFKPCQFCRD